MNRTIRLLFAAAAAVCVAGCATRFDDGVYRTEEDLPRIEALAVKIDGSMVFGQVLVPSAQFNGKRPCVILCHGFAGFTRWDDVAHDLCRAGIVAVLPHHRGAWGSGGDYTVSGCIKDATELAKWAAGAKVAEAYGIDPDSVWLAGHSMGGNTALNASSSVPFVRGVILIAPCDIGYIMSRTTKDGMGKFLVGEGLHALHRKSDEAVVDDIAANASRMRFVNHAKALEGKAVFLATGKYDSVVPAEPLDEFWEALPENARRFRRTYPAAHSLMGCRQALVCDLIEFLFDGCSNAGDVESACRENVPCGFVRLAEAVPDVVLEIRYYSTYNFVGDRIDGYERPVALLTKKAAAALKAASDDAVRRGYRLKIYDAYRPQRAVSHFMRWAKDDGDTRMKAAFYPNLAKGVLFEQGYIAEKSGHSRGSTVDLTLFDMRTGKEVDMGGTFDWFGVESHPDYKGITERQYANRMLLREIMVSHGFKPLAEEWWHFTLKDEPHPDTYFDFPVR